MSPTPRCDVSTTKLKLDSITKQLGSVTAIGDLTLSVRDGEFVSLLGPSGCGKTTVLRLIAGFISPDMGDLFISGERVNAIPSHRRKTAMVFQNYALFPHMTVAENIGFGPRMQRMPAGVVRRRVDDAVSLVQLSELKDRYPIELSGGQQQRVAVARALAVEPEVLLLDEPLSNLDAKLRKELRSELRAIQRRAGITTIFVTHDIEEALAISDRVAVLSGGRLQQYDSPMAIFQQPETEFVAQFVGHTNRFEGMVEMRKNGQKHVIAGRSQIFVPEEAPSGKMSVFFLPSHRIKVGRNADALENRFEGRVIDREYLGASVQLRLAVGAIELIASIEASNVQSSINDNGEITIGWKTSDLISIPAGGDNF